MSTVNATATAPKILHLRRKSHLSSGVCAVLEQRGGGGHGALLRRPVEGRAAVVVGGAAAAQVGAGRHQQVHGGGAVQSRGHEQGVVTQGALEGRHLFFMAIFPIIATAFSFLMIVKFLPKNK